MCRWRSRCTSASALPRPGYAVSAAIYTAAPGPKLTGGGDDERMRELTVVVTCTERKCRPPEPGLRVRDLPMDAGLDARAREWSRRVATTPNAVTLEDLYRGETWSQVAALAATAHRKGFQPVVLVASAGLGLRHVTSRAASYAATFSRRHEDTVGADRNEDRTWWQHLQAAPDAVDITEVAGSQVLLVLSAPYASAMHTDLDRLADAGKDVLLVGGTVDLPGISRLPSDKTLRAALGGTVTSLNLRTANAWMSRLEESALYSPASRKSWETWARPIRIEESFDRQPLTDLEVTQFIVELRQQVPNLSRTAALRSLRDSGYACEQQRFGDLFQRVMKATCPAP